ncbi:zinc-ribbon domain-containing protein [Halogranum gelatinilyticum]|uniref:Zinc-ribbon domain-containing protein n=1 Tax=Halogranum gelatinilyticum TaxID=660521 RepID=A0A1G9SQD3_9EURY|nr:zinc ribbon domain-containing protein [Halogranum gelatinilyticum]SDM37574.1 zinc-ribbon domain-containing protein [Halogranum gelatinilyticum]
MGLASVLKPLAAIGCFVVAFAMVILLGPPGIVAAAVFGAVVWAVWRATTYSSESTTPERTNCPSCGARNDVSAEVCGYCGDPL